MKDTNIISAIGLRFAYWRLERGISVVDAAGQVGLPKTALHTMEGRGIGGATFSRYIQYAAYLGVTLRQVFHTVLPPEINEYNWRQWRLIRVYMTAPEGRQITVRYTRPGDLLGIAALVGGPAPVSVQMLTDATLLMLDVRTLQHSGQTDPQVGWLMAQEVTRRLYETLEALAGNVFGSLRQRLARHLLDLAASRQQGRGLVVQVTQQELADAVGSVRPVIARLIRDLRVEGLITTASDGIVILKPAELHAELWSREV